LDAAKAYMERMERLCTIDSAVAADNGNDGSGGWGVEAGALGGNGITHVNCQAGAAAAAAVEEEEEEGAVDCDGDRAANGNGGPIALGNHEDGNKSTAPRTGRMTRTAATTATGGDWDRSAQDKLDHCNNGASDRYQSGGGGKTQDGSGGSSGGRGGRGSNRKKWRRRKYKGRGESTLMMVDFASRQGWLALNMFRSRRKMERNLFFICDKD
jgi:hypothetical protein